MKVRSLIPGLLATAALCLLQLVSISPAARAADTNSEPAIVTAIAATNVVTAMNPSDVEELRAKLDALQRANDLALGRWSALLDQNNALSNVLAGLQRSLENQRQREIQLSEESRAFNGRVMFGAGAAIFLVFLASYWFQLRCLNRVMEVTRATPELPAPFSPALLEAAKEAANTRESKLLEAIKLLEDRIRRFETPANGAAPTGVTPSARPATTPAMIVSGPNQPIFKGKGENGHAAPEAKVSEAVSVAAEPPVAEAQPASEVSVLLAKGELLLEAERMQEAVNVFNEALALEPDNAEAHLKKGIGLERLNRLELALASYNEALRLNPKRSFAYVYKARVLAALHRYDEALSVYDMALGKTKSNSNANGEAPEVNRTKAAV